MVAIKVTVTAPAVVVVAMAVTDVGKGRKRKKGFSALREPRCWALERVTRGPRQIPRSEAIYLTLPNSIDSFDNCVLIGADQIEMLDPLWSLTYLPEYLACRRWSY